MRILGAETEERVYELEAARGWGRSGLINAEQLVAVEGLLKPRPAQAGWAVRLLFFGFALVGACAADVFLDWALGDRLLTGAFTTLTAIPLYLFAEHLIRRHRLYRFGIEEGLCVGAVAQLCVGIVVMLDKHHLPARAAGPIIGVPATLALAWLYRRLGYLYAAFGAVLAGLLTVYTQLWNWSENEVRCLLAALCAMLCAAAFLRKNPSNHDRAGWQILQASLALGVYLFLNLRLDSLVQFHGRAPGAGHGAFYWTTFAAVWMLPILITAWSVPRRHRPMLVAGGIAALLTLMTNKPYLGLERHSWDPAALGALLIGTGWGLTRWLNRGPRGRRRGWTAEPVIVGRGDGPDLAGWIAAATAAGPSAAPQPEQKGFQGGGGSSGGAGAGGGF